MRRLFALLLCLALLYNGGVNAQAATAPTIAAKASVLIEANTGRVLSQQNADQAMPMASTTKIMTALVVLESANLSDMVTIGDGAYGIEGSSIYLEKGERLSVEQLLYGLLIRSGNDAAMALAIHVGGSKDGFVAMMNQKAADMGLTNTHFANPHGLPADGHYASAMDLAMIMAEVLEYPMFRQIISTPKINIPWDGHPWDRVLTNKNRLLDEVEGCLGGKTGYTKEAGRCLVEAVERNGMTLISVVLNCPDWWNQSQTLLEYGYAAFSMQPLLAKGDTVKTVETGGSPRNLPLAAAEDLAVPICGEESISLTVTLTEFDLPVQEGQTVGYATATIDGEPAGKVALLATAPAASNGLGNIIQKIFSRWAG